MSLREYPDPVDWNKAMGEVGGDKEFLDEVLQDLLNESTTAFSSLNDGITNFDFDKIQKAAHLIKGSAAILACGPLSAVSYDLQHLGQSGHTAKLRSEQENAEGIMKHIRDKVVLYKERLDQLIAEVEAKKG